MNKLFTDICSDDRTKEALLKVLRAEFTSITSMRAAGLSDLEISLIYDLLRALNEDVHKPTSINK